VPSGAAAPGRHRPRDVAAQGLSGLASPNRGRMVTPAYSAIPVLAPVSRNARVSFEEFAQQQTTTTLSSAIVLRKSSRLVGSHQCPLAT
ncbi:hypothetical protein, partial [Streptomyces sp. NPDC059970]|uniref:hypothetical protein n=1 Tax=Streptomyces sp. NPDC059970 TaxID=3347019 RepID=UPI00367598D4